MQIFKREEHKSKKKECEKENPYFFLEDFELKESNNGVRNGLHGAFGKETIEREDEQS